MNHQMNEGNTHIGKEEEVSFSSLLLCWETTSHVLHYMLMIFSVKAKIRDKSNTVQLGTTCIVFFYTSIGVCSGNKQQKDFFPLFTQASTQSCD